MLLQTAHVRGVSSSQTHRGLMWVRGRVEGGVVGLRYTDEMVK